MRGRNPVAAGAATLALLTGACAPGDPSGDETPSTQPSRSGPTMTLPTNKTSTSVPPSPTPTGRLPPQPGECRPTSSVRQRSVRADEPVKFLQFNLWGGPGHAGLTDLVDPLLCAILRDHLTAFAPAGAGPPALISLNEVCRSQYAALAPQLKVAGYEGFFYSDPGAAFSSCLAGAPEGIAVFSLRGIAPGSQRGYRISTLAEEKRPEGSRRNAACITTATGPRIRFCTAHPYKGPAIAGPQLARFVQVARRDAAGLPLVIAGDLNQKPSQDPPTAIEQVVKSFDDVDGGDTEPCQAPPPAGGPRYPGGPCTFIDPPGKIDYILLDRDHFRPGSAGVTFEPGDCLAPQPPGQRLVRNCSDHRQLWGLAYLDKVRFPSFAKRWTGPGYTVTIDALGHVVVDGGLGNWAVGQVLASQGRDSVSARISYATPPLPRATPGGRATPSFKSGKTFFLHHYRYGTVTTDLTGWQYLCGPDTTRLAPAKTRRSMKLPC